MTPLATERAPAKVNLCLYLGPTRADGRHELVTLFDSISVFDDLAIERSTRDEVVCGAVPGPNLVDDALAGLRATGWSMPPVRVTITKRIPVAAGMGGGSADAAAMLRAAVRLAPLPEATLARVASRLGADVPAQLRPGLRIGTGAGEILEPMAGVDPYGVLVLPQSFGLATADVYREADRLALARPRAALSGYHDELISGRLPPRLIVNDLQPAARSLAPAIGDALAAATGAGADQAMVCGSGPTVIGLFWGSSGLDRARRAAEGLRGVFGGAVAAAPVGGGVGAPGAKDWA